MLNSMHSFSVQYFSVGWKGDNHIVLGIGNCPIPEVNQDSDWDSGSSHGAEVLAGLLGPKTDRWKTVDHKKGKRHWHRILQKKILAVRRRGGGELEKH
jgi:hypothetical protein